MIMPLLRGTLSGDAEAAAGDGNSPSDIRALMLRIENRVSDFSTLRTDFVQEKDLAIFQNRIIIRGRIYIQKPQRIAWHVDEPVKYSVLITDRVIRQWDEDTDRVQEISLSGNPVFRTVIEQLTAWFSGRYVQLLDEYAATVIRERPLEIEFIPRDTSNVKNIIKSINVTFREDGKYLQKVLFREISGDSTTILFRNTVLNAPLDEKLFRVKPSRKLGQWMPFRISFRGPDKQIFAHSGK